MVKEILEEIDASLEPLREAKATAEGLLAEAQGRKDRSAANVLRGEQDLAAARRALADHEAVMKAKKAARAQARAESISTGRKVEAALSVVDMEGRRLQDEAEEVEAALNQLREMDGRHGLELKAAESAVADATEAVWQAQLEKIAARMFEQHSILQKLHAELSNRVPAPIHRRPGTRIASTVEKALGLVAVDWMNTPVSQLGAAAVVQMQFMPPDRTPKFHGPDTQTRQVAAEEISFVEGPKPRGAEAIRKTVVPNGGARGI